MWGVVQNSKLLEGGICETSEGKDSAHTHFENSWGKIITVRFVLKEMWLHSYWISREGCLTNVRTVVFPCASG